MPSEPFVKYFEKAIMQYVILNKAKEGEVTKENVKSLFRGNLQMSQDHVDECVRDLVQTGHIKESGNKLTITEDGREDIQKVQHLAVELPNVVSGGAQQRPGVKQPAGGGQYGSTSGSSMGGQSRRE